jgi:hypothetical protein
MLEDPLLQDRRGALIREERVNAEWALRSVSEQLHELFGAFSDAYFRERSTDLDDVLAASSCTWAGAPDAPQPLAPARQLRARGLGPDAFRGRRTSTGSGCWRWWWTAAPPPTTPRSWPAPRASRRRRRRGGDAAHPAGRTSWWTAARRGGGGPRRRRAQGYRAAQEENPPGRAALLRRGTARGDARRGGGPCTPTSSSPTRRRPRSSTAPRASGSSRRSSSLGRARSGRPSSASSRSTRGCSTD